VRFGRAVVNRRANRDRAHVPRLLHLREINLVERIGIRQELVMIELEEKWNPVGVFAGDRAEDTECGGHGITAAFDGKPHDVLRASCRERGWMWEGAEASREKR